MVTWPKQGWREIDEGTGNEAGYTEGSFDTWWEGSTLYGQNNAVQHNSDYEVDGKYILGYSAPPENIENNTLEEYEREFSYKKNKSNLNIQFNRVAFIFFIIFIISLIYSIQLIHLGSLKSNIKEIVPISSKKNYRADIIDINGM